MPRKFTYANVTATLALVVALSGSAVAAVQLGANTVGTKQLKANAVTSKKVKNNSLKAKDFKAGQLPAGAQGPAGADGTAKAGAVVSAAGTVSSAFGGLQASNTSAGLYCITLSGGGSLANLVVTTDYNSSSTNYWDGTDDIFTIAGVVNNTTCESGTGKVVRVYNVDSGAMDLANAQFRVIVP